MKMSQSCSAERKQEKRFSSGGLSGKNRSINENNWRDELILMKKRYRWKASFFML